MTNQLPSTIRERLAELEHIQWAHWTAYMLNNLTLDNIERWRQQINTHYSELSETEKDSDRKWADRVLEILKDTSYVNLNSNEQL